MKRFALRVSVVLMVAGTPGVLASTSGAPQVPSVAGIELSDSYLPLEPVLDTLALLAWALWSYLAVVIVVRAIAFGMSRRGMRGADRLLAASTAVTPRSLRRLIDVAFSSALMAASLAGTIEVAQPAQANATAVIAQAQPQGSVEERAQERQEQTVAYHVQPGDSLWRIAERELGSGSRWREIFDLNHNDRFADGRRLTNPRLIYPGWELRLPSNGQRAVATPPATDARNAHQARSGVTPATSLSEPIPEPAPSRPLNAQSYADEESRDDESGDQARSPTHPFIRLPSGVLVATSFASGVLAADLLSRLRYRRRAKPAERAAEHREPSELVRELRVSAAAPAPGQLDLALEAVAEAYRSARDVWPKLLFVVEREREITLYIDDDGDNVPPDAGGTVSPRVAFSRGKHLLKADVGGPFPQRLRSLNTPLQNGITIPLGAMGDGSAFHLGAMATKGVALRGASMPGLLRHAILSLCAAAGADDLKLVLIGLEPEFDLGEHIPHAIKSCTWDGASDVLRDVQAQLLWRARLLVDEGVSDIWEHLASDPDERLPALVIVASEPPQPLRGLVTAIAQQAPPLGATVFAAGWAIPDARAELIVEGEVELRSDFDSISGLHPFTLDPERAHQALDVIQPAFVPDDQEDDEDAVIDSVSSEVVQAEVPSWPPVSAVPAAVMREAIGKPVVVPQPAPGIPALRCLGPFEVSRDDRVLKKGWRSRAKEFLAYLAAHPDGAPKDRIIEEIWSDVDPKIAAMDVDRIASAVRNQVRGPDDYRKYVENSREFIRLQPGFWWTDVGEMQRLIEDAEQHEEATDAIPKLRSALSLYRGEFCDDAYYSWAEGVRERFRTMVVRASLRLARILAEAGAHEDAIAALDRAIEVDVVCEDLYRRAMVLEATIGLRSAALMRYERLKVVLAERLAVDPDSQTRSLAAKISREERDLTEAASR